MTDHDKDTKKSEDHKAKKPEPVEASAKDEAKEQQKQKIVSAYKGLKAQGFSKDQVAQQLGSKFAMTTDEVSAVLADEE